MKLQFKSLFRLKRHIDQQIKEKIIQEQFKFLLKIYSKITQHVVLDEKIQKYVSILTEEGLLLALKLNLIDIN